MQPKKICYSYQKGDCSKGTDCRFEHIEGLARKQSCYAYLMTGFCAKDAECRFDHDYGKESSKPLASELTYSWKRLATDVSNDTDNKFPSTLKPKNYFYITHADVHINI